MEEIKESVRPGEIKYFFSGWQEHEGTWTYQLTTKKPFDPRKLEITVCKVESRNFVTFIDYGDNEGPELSDASNDYDRTLEVIKVDKTQVAGKLKKDYQEIRYFEFKDAHSSKFWEVSVAGSTVTARYGKIGTNGQTSVKELDSPEQAQEHARKQAAGKLKKGYQEI
jgi:predicted DNA-binding WGR domain protein